MALNINQKDATRELIDAVHAAGYRIAAWTVNDPERARLLLDWGIDGIFTDELAAIRPVRLKGPGARVQLPPRLPRRQPRRRAQARHPRPHAGLLQPQGRAVLGHRHPCRRRPHSLDGDWATKTAESADGIGRLWERDDLPPILAEYMQRVRAYNTNGRLRRYPGSPWLTLDALRPSDRLRMFEMHPTEIDTLVGNRNTWTATPSARPPSTAMTASKA